MAGSYRKALWGAGFLSVIIIVAVALTNYRSLTQWNLFPESRVAVVEEIPKDIPLPPPEPIAKTPERKRLVIDTKGELLPQRELPKLKELDEMKKGIGMVFHKKRPTPVRKHPLNGVKNASFTPPPAKPNGYRIRFASFIVKENAYRYKERLGDLGVKAEVNRAVRQMPVYRVKAGPFQDRRSRKRAVAALRKIGVATLPFLEQEYVVTGQIWSREKLLKLKRELKRMSVGIKVESQKKTKTLYTVRSQKFSSRSVAKSRLEELKKEKIDGILEGRGV